MSLKQFINTKFSIQFNENIQSNKNVKIVIPKEIKNNSFKCELLSNYILLRVLINIPVFVGYDLRNYKLNKNDVATIPTVNAKALIKRKVAVEINIGVVQWAMIIFIVIYVGRMLVSGIGSHHLKVLIQIQNFITGFVLIAGRYIAKQIIYKK